MIVLSISSKFIEEILFLLENKLSLGLNLLSDSLLFELKVGFADDLNSILLLSHDSVHCQFVAEPQIDLRHVEVRKGVTACFGSGQHGGEDGKVWLSDVPIMYKQHCFGVV